MLSRMHKQQRNSEGERVRFRRSVKDNNTTKENEYKRKQERTLYYNEFLDNLMKNLWNLS